MLKIQLCPESELENPHWYTVDVLVFIVACMIAWLGSGLWLGNLRDEIARLSATTANWDKQFAEAQPVVAKFKGLDEEVGVLNRKISALKLITVNHPDKVKPIVVLEQLQTLKPDGLWYESIAYEETNTVKITGGTSDGLLVSEFLLGLRETMNPETWSSDLRTQIGYTKITVKEVKRAQDDKMFKDLDEHLHFEAGAMVDQKQQPPLGATAMVPPARSDGARF